MLQPLEIEGRQELVEGAAHGPPFRAFVGSRPFSRFARARGTPVCPFAQAAVWTVAAPCALAYRRPMATPRKAKSASQELARYGIVIAGGGFVGGTLALALARLAPKGFRVALVDAAPRDAGARKDARGLALSAATKSLLEAVGLWPAVAPNAQPICSIEITDSPLNASLRPHFLGFDEEMKAGAPSAYLVEAGDLLSAIHGGGRVGGRDRCVRAGQCRRLRNRRLRRAGDARKRHDASRAAPRRRRRQALATSRARRHQMHRLVLSANRHRRHRRP